MFLNMFLAFWHYEPHVLISHALLKRTKCNLIEVDILFSNRGTTLSDKFVIQELVLRLLFAHLLIHTVVYNIK